MRDPKQVYEQLTAHLKSKINVVGEQAFWETDEKAFKEDIANVKKRAKKTDTLKPGGQSVFFSTVTFLYWFGHPNTYT